MIKIYSLLGSVTLCLNFLLFSHLAWGGNELTREKAKEILLKQPKQIVFESLGMVLDNLVWC